MGLTCSECQPDSSREASRDKVPRNEDFRTEFAEVMPSEGSTSYPATSSQPSNCIPEQKWPFYNFFCSGEVNEDMQTVMCGETPRDFFETISVRTSLNRRPSSTLGTKNPRRPFRITLEKSEHEMFGFINDFETYNTNGDKCLRITVIRPEGKLFEANRKVPVENRVCVGCQIRFANGVTEVAAMRKELAKEKVVLKGWLPSIDVVRLVKEEGKSLGLRIGPTPEDPAIIRILGVTKPAHEFLRGCSVIRVNGVEGSAELLEQELGNTEKTIFKMDVRHDHVNLEEYVVRSKTT